MRKLQTVMLALLAVFALGALFASIASAEVLLAEWLENGAAITTAKASETTGAIKLEDNKAPIVGKAAVTCSGVLAGTVNSNGLGTVTAVLNAAKEATGAPLSGLALLGTGVATGEGSECKKATGCAEGGAASPIEVWPLGLPWTTELELEGTVFVVRVTSATEVGYEILCLVLGIDTVDKCTQPSDVGSILVQNNATTGDAETPSKTAVTPNANCELGGAGSGVNETEGVANITLTSGVLLAVSSV